jgi:hypothetical protein
MRETIILEIKGNFHGQWFRDNMASVWHCSASGKRMSGRGCRLLQRSYKSDQMRAKTA